MKKETRIKILMLITIILEIIIIISLKGNHQNIFIFGQTFAFLYVIAVKYIEDKY